MTKTKLMERRYSYCVKAYDALYGHSKLHARFKISQKHQTNVLKYLLRGKYDEKITVQYSVFNIFDFSVTLTLPTDTEDSADKKLPITTNMNLTVAR